MNKEKLTELLDSVYELEGLIHLALGRDDNPDHLYALISRKGEIVAKKAIETPDEATNPDKETPSAAETSSADAGTPETVPAVEEAVIAEKLDTPFCKPDAPCPQDLIDSEVRIESDAIDEIVEEMARESINEEAVRGKLVFTLNDRFRFKRELFGNSDADFNNTLVLVASMENYDEAEDYFINELRWDPAREDVKDFLDILRKYFK